MGAEYALRREESAPRAIGEFDHLVQQNDLTRMGALRFTERGARPGASSDGEVWLTAKHTAANPHHVGRIARAGARFQEYEATEEDMEILGYADSGLGGARPKATIRHDDGSMWMLKLPSNRDRRIDTEAWEATALDLAEQAGLRVPGRKLTLLDEHKSSLLIERFDRSGNSQPGTRGHRVGYISAVTAMQLGPQNQHATYEDFAETIAEVTPASLRVLAQMFLDAKREVGRSEGTLETYGYAVTAHITPKIGDLAVAEAKPERLQPFVNRVEKESGPVPRRTAARP